MQQFKFAAFFFFCLLAFAQNVEAQGVVGTLSIQGVLKKTDGSAVDNGNYSLTFKLYTAATGGTAIWTETQPDVEVIGGIYSASLGTVSPLTPAFDVPYFLGVQVASGPELQPRMALTAAPYALALLGTAPAYFGDVKTSFQTTDHAGWIRLDGRAKTTLSITQQARANSLGIGANLPNDDDLVATGTSSTKALGTTGGNNTATTTIARNQLPNVTLSGSGSVTEGVYGQDGGLNPTSNSLPAPFKTGVPFYVGTASVTGFGGIVITTSSINGGVTQQPISLTVTPQYLAMNYFMYLGL